MKRNVVASMVLAGIASIGMLVQCEAGQPPKVKVKAKAEPAKKEEAHEHATEGPHHGALIELGDEEYHAEIVHGKDHTITVYILDSEAKKSVPIDAKQVLINLSHDGKAEQFKLVATPDKGDPQGKSSRFLLKDEELSEDLDSEKTMAKLVVAIKGKSYTAKIEHHHEEGEEHEHKK